MVTENHYRWDFIGLSTDDKPTPATSERVVDGSTYYTSDDSKLYVFCKDQWYEKIPIGGGGGGDEKPLKDINFYDYDGTIVESWTLEELADKTELPENPEHEGLTAEGWNWSLADLKTNNLPQDVGQIYRPTDGKTHLIIDNTDGYLNPILGLGVNGTATINWGDNTTPTVLTGNNIDTMQDASHTYASAGTYDVSIELAEGTTGKIRGDQTYPCQLWKGSEGQPTFSKLNYQYSNQVKEVYIGSGWSKLWLTNTIGLKLVTLPKSLTFLSNDMLGSNSNLTHVNIPDTITTTNQGTRLLYGCRKLKSVSFPNIALTVENVLNNCTSIKRVTLPRKMTYVPGGFFYGCLSLQDVVLHEGITGLRSTSFSGCSELQKIKAPSTVTRLYSQTFYNTGMLIEVDLSSPSSVVEGNATMFGTFNATTFAGFKILVPESLEDDYKADSVWSTYADYIVGV